MISSSSGASGKTRETLAIKLSGECRNSSCPWFSQINRNSTQLFLSLPFHWRIDYLRYNSDELLINHDRLYFLISIPAPVAVILGLPPSSRSASIEQPRRSRRRINSRKATTTVRSNHSCLPTSLPASLPANRLTRQDIPWEQVTVT